MAYPTTNYIYPDKIGDVMGFKAGVTYCARANSANDKDSYNRMAEVAQIDLSNIIDNILETEVIKELPVTFTNGVKLVARFRTKSSGISEFPICVWVKYGLKRTDNTITDLGDWISPTILSSNSATAPANACKTFGAKFYILNNFTPYNDQATVEGVTHDEGLYFCMLLPARCTAEPSAIRNNMHVHSGMNYVTHFGTEIPYETARDWWYNTLNIPPIECSYGIHDLDDFAALVSGGGTPVNKDDIFGPGSEDDPSQEDDPSGPGGGGGNYDDTSDPIDFPPNPTGGALSSGAIKAFIVTPAILTAVFNKLWDTSIFDIPLQFQKLVDNPIDCIISLHCIPCVPSNTGAQSNIKIGNFDTENKGVVIDNQYLTIDCGSLSIKEFWGSALDYSPYTKVELFMPFVGIRELKIEDIMKSTIHIKYNVDVFTGDCLCHVKCGQSVLYKFAGNLKQDIPVSGRTNNMGIKGMLGAATAFAGGMMGGAVGGPMGAAIGVGSVISSAASVASSKITTTRSGSISGSVGLLDDFRPFFIFHRPVQSLANKFNTFKGYPSNITRTLSTLSGYTEVEYINLQNIPNATSEEMDEIKSLLKSGVLL